MLHVCMCAYHCQSPTAASLAHTGCRDSAADAIAHHEPLAVWLPHLLHSIKATLCTKQVEQVRPQHTQLITVLQLI